MRQCPLYSFQPSLYPFQLSAVSRSAFIVTPEGLPVHAYLPLNILDALRNGIQLYAYRCERFLVIFHVLFKILANIRQPIGQTEPRHDDDPDHRGYVSENPKPEVRRQFGPYGLQGLDSDFGFSGWNSGGISKKGGILKRFLWLSQ